MISLKKIKNSPKSEFEVLGKSQKLGQQPKIGWANFFELLAGPKFDWANFFHFLLGQILAAGPAKRAFPQHYILGEFFKGNCLGKKMIFQGGINHTPYLNKGIGNFLNSYQTKSFDEHLKEVEKRFRDPQLLIKTIEEMNLKQQEAIAAVQLNLNKMAQVKQNLKSSNEFKPYLSFSKDLFGQLNLNEFSIDLFKSQILTCQQPLELIKLCEFDLKDKF